MYNIRFDKRLLLFFLTFNTDVAMVEEINAITFSVSCIHTMHNGLIKIWNFFARHGTSTSENEYADDYYDAEDDKDHGHSKEIYISSSGKDVDDKKREKQQQHQE